MDLHLTRPLVVFDIESTGISWRTDRIIDLALIKLMPDGSQQEKAYRVHPGIPIPPESSMIHNIFDKDVVDCPTFEQVAPDLLSRIQDCDLGGYNMVRFDLPLLQEEFKRANVDYSPEGVRLIDAQRIFHQREPRDLSAALKFYCGELHLGAHGAMEDTLATVQVLQGQLEKYPDLPRDIEALHEYCNPRDASWVDQQGKLKWSGKEIVINFGRNQGRKLRELVQKEPGFLQWILQNEFPEDMKTVIRKAQDGRYPPPPETPTS